jgi:hypothetical protein
VSRQPAPPCAVGVPWQPPVLGKHSGRHAVQKRLSDLGLSVDAERMVAVYRALFSSDTLIDFLARLGIRVRFVVTPSRRRTEA